MPTASTSTSVSTCSWSGCPPARAEPSSVVNTALVIGFGLMTIYSLVIFIKDLKSGNKLDGEVDA